MVNRCQWANSHPLLIKYHDEEWGNPVYDDQILYENLILETFSTGLSWLIILKKRDAFRKAFDYFDIEKVMNYDENKINELLQNKEIVRSKAKIIATIQNSKIIYDLQKEYGSFSNYLWNYTNHTTLYPENYETHNALSDLISSDLKKRGMKFFGSVTCYSYMQSIGMLDCHSKDCFKYKKR